MHEKIHEKLLGSEYQDLKHLGDDWDLLRNVYKENCRGPAKHEVGERVGLNKMYEDMSHLFFVTKANFDKEMSEHK